jgi:hypothetical protein
MSVTSEQQSASADGLRRHVRRVVFVAAGLLLAGALYLYAVRGPAMLLDLANSARGLLCF